MTDWLAKKANLLAKFNPSHDELGRFSSASNSSVAPAGGGRGGGASSTLAFTEGTGAIGSPEITIGEHHIYLQTWGDVSDPSLPLTDDNWVESFQAIYEGPATEEWMMDTLSNSQWFADEREHAEGLLIEWLQKVSAGAKQR